MRQGVLDFLVATQRAAGIDAIGGLRLEGAAVSANSPPVKESSTTRPEGVVPVVSRWSQALDRPVAADHFTTRPFASFVVIEAAVDMEAASQ